MLSPTHRRQLLTLARQSIDAALAGRTVELDSSQYDDVLKTPAGAFVTLTDHGELRGCIGSIQPVAPLYQAVSMSAINAAFRDPRFHPLTPAEWPEIELEISVMGPIERVSDLDQIVVGRDGLIVTRGRYAGLLLPQVASERGWDRETFLRQTCVKAGLPPDVWRSEDCRIEKFAAEVFGDANN
ncbi:MAG TPA: AmmeMemoRadiSam system protein A [Thermoanaerobaculia bacterium]|jgi:AmmeMemoRadiSam system protein A